MALHYGYQRDVAFTTRPPDGVTELYCEDFQVQYGMRGRIGNATVIGRAQRVVAKLIPERNYIDQLSQLPAPRQLSDQRNWCDSINLDGAARSAFSAAKPQVDLSELRSSRDLHGKLEILPLDR